MEIFKFENGAKVKDLVTGVEGIITGRAEYLNGCVNYCVKPKLDKEGKVAKGEWVDEPQLVALGKGVSSAIKKNIEASRRLSKGGPRADAAPER